MVSFFFRRYLQFSRGPEKLKLMWNLMIFNVDHKVRKFSKHSLSQTMWHRLPVWDLSSQYYEIQRLRRFNIIGGVEAVKERTQCSGRRILECRDFEQGGTAWLLCWVPVSFVQPPAGHLHSNILWYFLKDKQLKLNECLISSKPVPLQVLTCFS